MFVKNSLIFSNSHWVCALKMMGLASLSVCGHTSEEKKCQALPTLLFFWPSLPVFSQNFNNYQQLLHTTEVKQKVSNYSLIG